MTKQELANIIFAEVGVMGYDAKLATGQCVRDNGYNPKAFAPTTYNTTDKECLEAAEQILKGNVPFPNCKLIKMRSASYQNEDGSPNWQKLAGPPDPFTESQYEHIVTYMRGKWSAMFFGTVESNDIYRVVVGSFFDKDRATEYGEYLKKEFELNYFIERGKK